MEGEDPNSGEVVLRGVAASGLRQATHLTEIPWVARQFAEKLGFRPRPGTFNVRITDPRSQSLWATLARQLGIEIQPPDSSACVARCYPVIVNERITGVIVVPHVPGYPIDQIEVISERCIRVGLGLDDGDEVTLRVLAGLSHKD